MPDVELMEEVAVKRILAFAFFTLIVSADASAAIVTGLAAAHRNGQTFVTFIGVGLEGDGTTYTMWRDSAPIVSTAGLVPVTTLPQDSGHLRYDDNPTISGGQGQNLKTGFVITDLGPHLSSGTGLYVHTTAVSGPACYAVTNSTDQSIQLGNNSLSACVSETHQDVPGAVLVSIDTTLVPGRAYRHYYAWDDKATWRDEWGYYGHALLVVVATTGSSPHPLALYLHAAGCGYEEPQISASWPTDTVVVAAHDLCMGSVDPYSNTAYPHANWTGRLNTGTGLYMTETEDRVSRFVQLVRDNRTGDGFDFHADPQRVYVKGASLGSNSMYVCAHHAEWCAAAETSLGMITDTTPNDTTTHVNTAAGETVAQYRGLAYEATMHRLPPIIHTPNQNDPTGSTSPANYPAAVATFESTRQPYAIQWCRGQLYTVCGQGGHASFDMGMTFPQWTMFRFKRDELRPAFGNASTSNVPAGTFPWGNGSQDPDGQRNGTLDWQNALHGISNGQPIVDTVDGAALSLTSSAAATSDVTVGNMQAFHPEADVPWVASGGQSGTATRNADGSLTIVGLAIAATPAATRLALGAAPPPPPPPPSSTATFVGTDTTTRGSWTASYGAGGYVIPNDASSLPSGASVTSTGTSYTWAASTTDVRALTHASGTGRIASTWYSATSFTLSVNAGDAQAHQLSLYLMDWDNGGARHQTVDILDPATGTVLDTRNMTMFQSGQYWTWTVTGAVAVRVTNAGGSNAVVNGVFLGEGGPPPPPPPTWAPITVTPSHNDGADQLRLCADDGRCWGPLPRLQ